MFFTYGGQSYGGLPVYELPAFSIDTHELLSSEENLSIIPPEIIASIADNITLSEYNEGFFTTFIFVDDVASFVESIESMMGSIIFVSDTSVITELISTTGSSYLVVSSDLSLAEDISNSGESFAIVNSTKTISEIVSGVTDSPGIDVYDAKSITEDLVRENNTFGSVIDSLSISENVESNPSVDLTITDISSATEDINVAEDDLEVITDESVLSAEDIERVLVSLVNVNSDLTGSENIYLKSYIYNPMTTRNKPRGKMSKNTTYGSIFIPSNRGGAKTNSLTDGFIR